MLGFGAYLGLPPERVGIQIFNRLVLRLKSRIAYGYRGHQLLG